MMKSRLRTGGRTVSRSALLAVLLLLLFVLLIPLLALSRYAVPAADDFSFSCETHAAVSSGGGIITILAGALSKTREVYSSWQGSFSAVFLMTFQPSIWGFRFYGLTTYVMLIPLVGSLFCFCMRLFSGVFRIRKTLSACVAVIAIIACTQFLPSPNQAFYWYNGAVYYTFTFSLMLLLFASLIGFVLYGGRWRLAVSSLLAFVIGGNNYVTALLSIIIFSALLIIFLFRRDHRLKPLLLPFFMMTAAFVLNIIAPGNAVRQAFFPSHPGPLEAIIHSFRYAGEKCIQWLDLRMLSCLLALVPILWAGASEAQERLIRFRWPFAVSFFSFCLFASMFTPHVYAIGFDGPGRIQNIYFDAFVLLLILNLFWWFGWFSEKISGKRSVPTNGNIGLVPLFSCWGAGFLCLCCSVFLLHGSLASTAALGELRSGEAQRYYAEALERQAILENPSVKDCVFRPYQTTPYLLFFADLSEDPTSYENEDTANFYGKRSIVVSVD